MNLQTTAPFCNTDYHISSVTSRKIKAAIKASGIHKDFADGLMCRRYKVRDGSELTEAQGISFLEHLKGYGAE